MISRATTGLTVLTLALLSCVKASIRDDDLPVFVTIEDLRPLGFDLGAWADQQEFRRIWYLDGTLELEYEFDSPDESDESIFIATTAGFEQSVLDARAAFRIMKGSTGLGARVGGATIREDPQFFTWGDESFFAYLDGQSVGREATSLVHGSARRLTG